MLRSVVSPSRVAAAVLLTLAFAAPAAAQEIKVAIIDTQQILLNSETGKAALADLEQLRETKEAEGQTKQEEAQALRDQLTQGRLSLAEDKIAELEEQLQEKLVELRRFQEDANNELNSQREKVLAGVDRQVMPIIAAIGEEQGYSLIFRKFESGLVFASDEVDITQEVIARLDASSGG